LCNTDKGAGDDTDFRAIREGRALREKGCVFCELDEQRIVASNTLAVAIHDRHPVTPLHSLVIPRRHVVDYFDLHDSEVRAIHRLIEQVRVGIVDSDSSVRAFNFGVNSGRIAGQTVLHAHVHLIPRRAGDVENSRGGCAGNDSGSGGLRVNAAARASMTSESMSFVTIATGNDVTDMTVLRVGGR
jgi:ATP adenylyltransferase